MSKPKLIRITTVPSSLKILLRGQHRFMSDHFEVIGVSSSGKELEDVEEEEEIRVVPIEMTRTIAPISDLRSVWKLYKLLKKERPDIVHTHTPKAGIVGMMAARLAGVKVRLHTVAGMPLMEISGVKRRLLNVVEKLTYRWATHVYPNSKGLYEFILEQRFTRSEKLSIIANGSSNGIDINHFNPDNISEEIRQRTKHDLGIKEDDFVFIFVGRLVGDKGINELIAVFEEISKLHSNAKLLMLGDFEHDLDPLQEDTFTVIKSNDRILAVGFQKDVRPFFTISDMLVFPSYREGFPNVVMQAGAMGLPAIVSNINGCNEIIIEGENGWIIPPKSVEALKEVMLRALANRSPSMKPEVCRNFITERYEQSIVWKALLNEYQNLLKGVS